MGRMQNFELNADSPRELLENFRKLTLRQFMVNRRVAICGAEEALWHIIYGEGHDYEHSTVIEVIKECESQKATVGDVLDGKWQPKALQT